MSGFEEDRTHRDFREVVRKFVAREITPYVEEWTRNRSIPRDIWLKIGKQGFLCPWLPEEYGGHGLDYGYSVILEEELIRGNAFGVGTGLHCECATPYIYHFGTDELKRRLLPKCASGEAIAAIDLTEPNAGSDLAAIRTKAVRDGDCYVINGQKTFITGGVLADVHIVACKIQGTKGISMIVAEAPCKGLTVRPLEKIGWHMQDTAEVFFEDCRVPAGNLLGEEGQGFKYMMRILCRERLIISLGAQVLAEECLKEALNYSKVREAFGKPIGNLQHNAFKLAQMATKVDIGRTYINFLINEFIKGEDITLKVSMAKAWIGEMVQQVAYEAVQLHGGYGCMEEYRVARLFTDVRGFSIFGGSTEIMNLIISRNLGLDPA